MAWMTADRGNVFPVNNKIDSAAHLDRRKHGCKLIIIVRESRRVPAIQGSCRCQPPTAKGHNVQCVFLCFNYPMNNRFIFQYVGFTRFHPWNNEDAYRRGILERIVRYDLNPFKSSKGLSIGRYDEWADVL